MNILEFDYELDLGFSAPVTDHRFLLRCLPLKNASQSVGALKWTVAPESTLWISGAAGEEGTLEGSVNFPHEKFSVKVRGRVLEKEGENSLPPHAHETFFTRATFPNGKLKEFARGYEKEPLAYSTAVKVMHGVHEWLKYRTDLTDEDCSAGRAAILGGGVCQDFAHVYCCVMRLLGVPTRYVAGLGCGHGETHAWNECYIDGRWRAFDCTNDRSGAGGYVKFAVGADAEQCALNRGVFTSVNRETVRQTQTVRADVRMIDL